jgi:general secretion pathway protein C
VALDALLKKHFTLVVLALVAVVAYFQASGTVQLIGAALGVSEAALVSAVNASGTEASGGGLAERRPSAQPIIDRNPFDSVTGPLKAHPMPVAGVSPADLSDPLGAAACDGVQVFIVTQSSDPTWSFAAVQGPGEPHPRLRRVGDEVADKQVAFIGFNPREASPSVWMTSAGGAGLCQATLFAEHTEPGQASKPAAAPAPGGEAAGGEALRAGPAVVPPEIASKIQKVSDTEFNVDRGVVDKILENQAELMKSARIVPEHKDGKVVGIRLFGIRPNTLLGTLGLQNGDRLESINGYNMSSPEAALEAYAHLRTSSNLNVKVSRRGAPVSIDYRIK